MNAKGFGRWTAAIVLCCALFCATASALTQEQAQTYSDILESQVNLYGYAEYGDYESARSPGLFYAKLVDFNGDGKLSILYRMER